MPTLFGFPLPQGIYENVVVSAVFFGLDLILVALLLPFILSVLENRKWAPMRREIVAACIHLLNDILAKSHGVLGLFDESRYLSFEDQRKNTLWFLLRADSMIDEMDDSLRRFREELDFLSPAVEPSSAGSIVRLRRATEEYSSLTSMTFKQMLVNSHLEGRMLETGERFAVVAPRDEDAPHLKAGLEEKVAEFEKQVRVFYDAGTALVRRSSLSTMTRVRLMRELLDSLSITAMENGAKTTLRGLATVESHPPGDDFPMTSRATDLWTLSPDEIIERYRKEAAKELRLDLSKRHSVDWFNRAGQRGRERRSRV
jgi:hypothetical protein